MSEDAPAPSPAKATRKKPAAPQKKAPAPSLQKLVLDFVKVSTERHGLSASAIKKLLASKGIELDKYNKRVNGTIKKLVTKGALIQTKGTGASGSFKAAGKEPVKKVVKVVKKSPAKTAKPSARKSPVKKPAAKKAAAKKPAAKKPAAKKPAAKKAVPKAKVAAKPAKKKVTKKPVEKKSLKAVNRSPKKVAAKKPVKKTSAAKKSKK